MSYTINLSAPARASFYRLRHSVFGPDYYYDYFVVFFFFSFLRNVACSLKTLRKTSLLPGDAETVNYNTRPPIRRVLFLAPGRRSTAIYPSVERETFLRSRRVRCRFNNNNNICYTTASACTLHHCPVSFDIERPFCLRIIYFYLLLFYFVFFRILNMIFVYSGLYVRWCKLRHPMWTYSVRF